MKFDTEFPTCREGVFVPVNFADPEQIVSTVETAEALGYHAVWGTDFIAPDALLSDPGHDAAGLVRTPRHAHLLRRPH